MNDTILFLFTDSSGKLLRRNLTGNHNKNSNNNLSGNNSNNNSNNFNQHIFAPKSRGSGGNGSSGGSGGGGGGVEKRQHRSRDNGHQRGAGPAASTSNTRLNEYGERCRSDDSGEFEIEMNSVYLPGSKKQNLNHLLNFNYAPRDRHDANGLLRSGNCGKGYVKPVKYNKEQFLQAK